MKNPLIFVLSITSSIRRGRNTLAPQEAGVFRLYEKQAICTRRDASIMGVSLRAERLVVDSGRGKSLFVCPGNVNYHHHVQRNLRAFRAQPPQQKYCKSQRSPGQDGQATCIDAKAHPSSSKTPEGFEGFTRLTLTSALPPAAFFHTPIFLIGLLLERGEGLNYCKKS